MARPSYSYVIPLTQVAPLHDPEFRQASFAVRREFNRALIQLGIQLKERELALGLDRFGQPLAPISRYTREHRRSAMGPADPNAPALQPAHGLSRTRSLLDGRVESGQLRFFWRLDPVTGQPWGRVLHYHREGRGRLPARDVIGLSPQSVVLLKQQAESWWLARRFGPVQALPAAPGPLPAPPRFLVAPVRAYRPKNPLTAPAPLSNRRVSQIQVNSSVYTLQSGSAAQINRMIANGSFSGFRKRG